MIWEVIIVIFFDRWKLKRYLHKGLNLDDFDVIDILPQNTRHAVIIMRNKNSEVPTPWCLQYCGNGHYFNSKEELDNYFKKRKFKR